MRSISKILLLGLGIAMGLVLIAKIYFDATFENFAENSSKIFQIAISADKENAYSLGVPGALPPAIKNEAPQVAYATRYIDRYGAFEFTDKAGNKFNCGKPIFTDSSFFDIFTRKIYAGNPRTALLHKEGVMISKNVAEKINGGKKNFGDLIGMVLKIRENEYNIEGVFEDFPNNSQFRGVEAVLPLSSLKMFGLADRSSYWDDNRYYGFIKLKKAAAKEECEEIITRICRNNMMIFSPQERQKLPFKGNMSLIPVSEIHFSKPDIKRASFLLLLIAVIVVTSALLNYILISISEMVHKAKAIAVMKCYGASRKNIYYRFLKNAALHLTGAIAFSTLLIISGVNLIEELIGTSVVSLIQGNSMILISGICLFILVITGLIPGSVYNRIPVATAFRKYRESSRKWKHALLFVQFTTTSMFITLLLIVISQYRMMLHTNPGYDYKNLITTMVYGMSENRKNIIAEEIGKLPHVNGAVRVCLLPYEGSGWGTEIMLPDKEDKINASDLWCVGNGYFSTLNVPIIEGRGFNEETPRNNEVMVNRSCAERLSRLAGWTDGVIGKDIKIPAYSRNNSIFTICGVYENYLTGTLGNSSLETPGIQIHTSSCDSSIIRSMNWLIINISPGADINKIINTAKKIHPSGEFAVNNYFQELEKRHRDSRRFKDSVSIACIIILIITLMGVTGYAIEEINRRKSEIAIRKINGASLKEILILFNYKILIICIPAMITGSIGAYYFASEWLSQFSNKIHLGWEIFFICSLVVIILILCTVTATVYRRARANPAESLGSE